MFHLGRHVCPAAGDGRVAHLRASTQLVRPAAGGHHLCTPAWRSMFSTAAKPGGGRCSIVLLHCNASSAADCSAGRQAGLSVTGQCTGLSWKRQLNHRRCRCLVACLGCVLQRVLRWQQDYCRKFHHWRPTPASSALHVQTGTCFCWVLQYIDVKVSPYASCSSQAHTHFRHHA